MFENYSEQARRAIFFARYETSRFGSPQMEVEHLLLGVLREHSQLPQPLSPAKVEAIRDEIRKASPIRPAISASVDPPLSKACKSALNHAEDVAKELSQSRITPDHFLLGIAHDHSSLAARILRDNGITYSQLRDEALRSLAPGMVSGFDQPRPALDRPRDLIEKARNGMLGPLIGRERELERIIHILSRRTKNNAVLIGDAGVGKSAIVDGLALRMAEADVPPQLADRRLVALDATSLMSPRQRTRSLEQVESVLACLDQLEDTVLFVRGLFNLAAAGKVWAVVEAMHALEPHLAHGGIQCIATGSPIGLRETVEKAGILARHFEVVEVAPVSENDAIGIVSALKERFEQFHDVTFGDGAIAAAVYASGRFLPDRHLPDRAIDLIDEAAALVRLRRESEPREVADAYKRIRHIRRAMDNAIANHEFETARNYDEEERRQQEILARLREKYKPGDTPNRTVTPDDIEAAVAARAGVPVETVRRVMQQETVTELQRISGELAAHAPAEAREWIPFLAAYLARCSASEAETLARAIQAAKSDRSSSAGG